MSRISQASYLNIYSGTSAQKKPDLRSAPHIFSVEESVEHGGDKGNTDHKKERLMFPMEGHSVFLRKHWTTGREVTEVVGCWLGLASEGLPCMCRLWHREDQVHPGLERSWLLSWAGLPAGPVVLVW